MRQPMKTPIWPYIAVVACLFVLSVLAPRAWRGPANHPVARVVMTTPVPAQTPPTVIRAEEPAVVSSPTRPDESLAELDPFFQRELPSLVAPIQPPVAEQIKLDVAVPLTAPISTPPAATAPPMVETPQKAPELPPIDTPVSFAATPAEQPAEVVGDVPMPADLLAAIRTLGQDRRCANWANRLAAILEAIRREKSIESDEMDARFRDAYDVLKQTPALAESVSELEIRAQILRCGYAAKRRVDIWQQVHRIVAQRESADRETMISTTAGSDMERRLAEVESRLSETEHASEWRQYLMLAEVRRYLGPSDPETRREIAKRVLKRIDTNQLTESQAAIFGKSPFQEFSLELRRWAAEPVDYLRLLEHVESYEQSGSVADSQAIAAVYDVVRWSPRTELQQLGEILNSHYRNANVRVALTADFLNRLLPDPQAFQESVSNNIAGADVQGTSHTVNRLHVVLHPDPDTWQIGLEAHGEVSSDTAASKGPATFYNQGWGRYHARKLMMIDRRGIRVWRAETDADSESQLTGFETEFDPIPVLGWLARSVARSQHDQQYPNAKAETEEMMRQQASTRFDEEVHSRLATAEANVKQKLLDPFERINLKPTPLDMSTTEQRVIARYRLASDSQLGAQTPRPQAPANSLLSIQVHESALNNTLANLKLEGRKSELRQLYRDMAAVFDKRNVEIPEDIPEGVMVTFAEQEAVRVRCDQSRVTLTIHIAELKNGRSKWRDFAVRASYVPDGRQLEANLVREDAIEIIGDKLGIRERPPLRLIFSKVLSKSRSFNLINEHIRDNPHLTDSHVNQFVVNDGWIGIGIGPQTAHAVEQTARQPQGTSVQRK